MKKILFIVLLSITSFFCTAQLAPNFTIVTTKGDTLRLYEDLLNKKKTVVVKLFFVQCPFCQKMSPLAQQLYQKWGSGANGVEFLSLSVLSSNTNAMVANYKVQYGEKFPGAGNDGGSVTAVQPYTSGQFGAYYGTPTFFVISPDKTVEWDPRGASNQETIDSVDAAIARSRAKVGGSISGHLFNACCQAKPQIPIGFFRPNQTKPDTTITTDSTGYYQLATFPALWGDSSKIRVQPIIDSNLFNNPFQGISTADLVRMNKHILGIFPFECPYGVYASDVNNDGKVSTADMVELRKMILYIQTNFSNNTSVNFYSLNLKDSTVAKNISFNLGKKYTNDYQYDLIVSKTGDPTCSSFLMDEIGEERATNDILIHNQKIDAGFRQIPIIVSFKEPMEGVLTQLRLKKQGVKFVEEPLSYHTIQNNQLSIIHLSERADNTLFLGYLEGEFESGWLSEILSGVKTSEVVAPSGEYKVNVKIQTVATMYFSALDKKLKINESETASEILISDMTGKVMATKKCQKCTEIDLSALQNGIYIAKDNLGNYLKFIIR